MKIGIIGAGNIGRTLGTKWAQNGHEIIFGVRDPQAVKVQDVLAQVGQGARATAVAEAVAAADVVLFAIPGRAMVGIIGQLGVALNGKVLIDATNNVGADTMNSFDWLRSAAPDAALFRAFSTLGWENFADPMIDGVTVDLFYCGDSGEGQTAVASLIAEIGLNPVYVGGPEQVGLLDAFTRLWFVLALQQGRGRRLAFKLLVE